MVYKQHAPVSIDQHSAAHPQPTARRALTRRTFLRRAAALGMTGLSLSGLLAACGSGGEATDTRTAVRSVCAGVDSLTPQEIDQRRAVDYVEPSPHTDRICRTCRFFQRADTDAACGTCEVVPGPIAPAGYCQAWNVASG